ncbi:hypothetical protein POM88_027086 [Heracleum sosnowskyi]|uniref:Uncharacterized protein n=1 Tax=Heracleum sosnowskyi TaxID=360622 RepID=A0AAD8MPJ0_9APIA|nr:hypothetical protein POM88_027086 [Heracleum sosnowskyi]
MNRLRKENPSLVSSIPYKRNAMAPGNAMHTQNDMNHLLNHETPAPSEKPKTKTSTTNTKSSTTYQLSCGRESDVKRRTRLARYNAYAAGGRLKASMRKTFSWFKDN